MKYHRVSGGFCRVSGTSCGVTACHYGGATALIALCIEHVCALLL